MAMSQSDVRSLESALRSLGMLYGASQPFEITVANARDDAEAIRAYLELERPHLLACYDIETLVKMVRDARARNADGGSAVEQFSPRDETPRR